MGFEAGLGGELGAEVFEGRGGGGGFGVGFEGEPGDFGDERHCGRGLGGLDGGAETCVLMFGQVEVGLGHVFIPGNAGLRLKGCFYCQRHIAWHPRSASPVVRRKGSEYVSIADGLEVEASASIRSRAPSGAGGGRQFGAMGLLTWSIMPAMVPWLWWNVSEASPPSIAGPGYRMLCLEFQLPGRHWFCG